MTTKHVVIPLSGGYESHLDIDDMSRFDFSDKDVEIYEDRHNAVERINELQEISDK